jgi:hypothetical protein
MKVTWTPDMLQALRDLRSQGVPLYLCAERIGVGYPIAVYKAREVNLAQRLNRGRRPGESVVAGRKGSGP